MFGYNKLRIPFPGMSNGNWRYAMLDGNRWHEGGAAEAWTDYGPLHNNPAIKRKLLDKAGADGWELVAVEVPVSGLGTTWVFKRPA